MKRKPTSCSSAGFERLFGLFGVFAYDREACRGLGAKAFGPSRRFPAWLAPTSRCAKLHQNGRHHAADLLWSDWALFAFPWSMQGLSKLTCQIQLVQDHSHQPTPALKLLGSAHIHACPEQILLEETVAVFLGKAPTILARDLGQGDEVIEHDKPAHPWIALGAFGRFALHTDHRQSQLAVLLEMQMAPATGAHVPALGVLLVVNVLGWPMGFFAFALKQRPIFGAGSPFVEAHPRTVELAITFETHQDAVAQLLASPQERRGAVPPIGHHDDPTQAKERPQVTQLGNSHLNRGLLRADASLIQHSRPAAGLLGQQDHVGKLPADTNGFVDQRQVREMDHPPIGTRWGSRSLNVAGIDGDPDGLVVCSLGQQGLDQDASQALHIDLDTIPSVVY